MVRGSSEMRLIFIVKWNIGIFKVIALSPVLKISMCNFFLRFFFLQLRRGGLPMRENTFTRIVYHRWSRNWDDVPVPVVNGCRLGVRQCVRREIGIFTRNISKKKKPTLDYSPEDFRVKMSKKKFKLSLGIILRKFYGNWAFLRNEWWIFVLIY